MTIFENHSFDLRKSPTADSSNDWHSGSESARHTPPLPLPRCTRHICPRPANHSITTCLQHGLRHFIMHHGSSGTALVISPPSASYGDAMKLNNGECHEPGATDGVQHLDSFTLKNSSSARKLSTTRQHLRHRR